MGLNTLAMMFEKELEEKVSNKGKHSAERSKHVSVNSPAFSRQRLVI